MLLNSLVLLSLVRISGSSMRCLAQVFAFIFILFSIFSKWYDGCTETGVYNCLAMAGFVGDSSFFRWVTVRAALLFQMVGVVDFTLPPPSSSLPPPHSPPFFLRPLVGVLW